jgi:hypothetical protein
VDSRTYQNVRPARNAGLLFIRHGKTRRQFNLKAKQKCNNLMRHRHGKTRRQFNLKAKQKCNNRLSMVCTAHHADVQYRKTVDFACIAAHLLAQPFLQGRCSGNMHQSKFGSRVQQTFGAHCFQVRMDILNSLARGENVYLTMKSRVSCLQ